MNNSTEKTYMNAATGEVGKYDDWYYENENGETVNAVELGEVVEVVWDKEDESENFEKKCRNWLRSYAKFAL